MSSHDNEELIDYEDEHDVAPNGATAASATNGAAAPAVSADGDDKDKKNFSRIHSTGFRCVQQYHSRLLSVDAIEQGLLVET